MPKIRIPETVEILDDDDKPGRGADGKAVDTSFIKFFLTRTLLRDTKIFGESAETIYIAQEIRGAFGSNGSAKKPGDVVELTESQYRKLAQAAEHPSNPYNPQIMIQLGSYLDAILKPESK